MQTLPTEYDGKLSAFAWPGGYPIIYFDRAGCVLCPKCAQAELDYLDPGDPFRPESYEICFEGRDLYCEICKTTLKSAYGDPDNT